ncbi:MAG: winged helix-turn-helix domain-containing protein [Acidobacteriota bacterium]
MNGDFRVGKWAVYPQLGEMECSDSTVSLKPRVMELLVYFAKHQGEVLAKEHLLDTLWKDTFVAENALMNAVSELRKALGDETRNPSYITTHSKRGYRLIAPVEGMPKPSSLKPAHHKPPLRLAVLPFASHWRRSPDCGLAEALTNMVITTLADSKSIRVVSRTSANLCQREDVTLPELVQRLKVQRVLEGELVRTDDRIQVTVRLYNEDDDSLWGELIEHAGPNRASLETLARSIAYRVEET